MSAYMSIADLPCAAMVTDESGRIVEANTGLHRITAHGNGALVGQLIDQVLTGGTRIFFQTHVWPMLRRNGEVKELFFYMPGPQDERIPVYASASRMHGREPACFVWLFFAAEERQRFEAELIEMRERAERTAEQLKEAHERLRLMHEQLNDKVIKTIEEKNSLEEIARTDALTQMRNRHSLQTVAQELAQGGESRHGYSVLMVDIDHFKDVNDTYGHERGDTVIRDVGRCLQSVARQGDTAIRYGGEEFSLVLPDAEPEQALGVAERIHAAIADGRPGGLTVTVSIGVASSADGLDDLHNALRRADDALYAAKRMGRNRSVHERELPTHA
jgi:diguanylate cyclase (GGDEF)-like protein